jgi:hypothetical protein
MLSGTPNNHKIKPGTMGHLRVFSSHPLRNFATHMPQCRGPLIE